MKIGFTSNTHPYFSYNSLIKFPGILLIPLRQTYHLIKTVKLLKKPQSPIFPVRKKSPSRLFQGKYIAL